MYHTKFTVIKIETNNVDSQNQNDVTSSPNTFTPQQIFVKFG